jgi:type II secretory pathway pseudopilin PulG
MPNNSPARKAGFTLVEIMIALGLLMVVSLGIAEMMNQLTRSNLRSNLINTAQSVRQNVSEALRNTEAWKYTFVDPKNGSIKCICSTCSAFVGSVHALTVIRGPGNNVLYDGSDLTSGFSPNGARCTGFPSTSCPLRMDVVWTVSCAAPCTLSETPMFNVQGVFRYDVGTNPGANVQRISFNPASYGFNVFKSWGNQDFSFLATQTACGTGFNSQNGQANNQSNNGPSNNTPGNSNQTNGQSLQSGNPTSEQTQREMLRPICQVMGNNINDPVIAGKVKAQLELMNMGSYFPALQQTCRDINQGK